MYQSIISKPQAARLAAMSPESRDRIAKVAGRLLAMLERKARNVTSPPAAPRARVVVPKLCHGAG